MQAEQPERAGRGAVQVPAATRRTPPATAVRGSPPASSRSSRRCWSAQLADQLGQRRRRAGGGRARRRPAGPAAAGRTGRPARRRPPGRRRPGRRSAPAAGRRASAAGSRSRSGGRAPSPATSPASASRLVTTTSAAGRAGQQRPDLLGVAGVVQHDQHPPAGQQAAVAAGALVRARPGCPGRARPSARRNPAQRVGGGHRLAGVVAAQVHVQLPVGEPVGDLVRPVHGQRGLADPGGAADRVIATSRSPGRAAWSARPARRPGRSKWARHRAAGAGTAAAEAGRCS